MAGPRVLITPRAFLDLDGEHKNVLKQAGYEIVANPRPRTLRIVTNTCMGSCIASKDAVHRY